MQSNISIIPSIFQYIPHYQRGFHHFSMVLPSFSMVFPSLFHGFSIIFHGFSPCFPRFLIPHPPQNLRKSPRSLLQVDVPHDRQQDLSIGQVPEAAHRVGDHLGGHPQNMAPGEAPKFIQCEAPKIAKLVNITPITMVYGTYNIL